MGGCTSDIYQTVKKEHGEVFKKYIVGSQSLFEFKKLVKITQQSYDAQAEQKRKSIHSEIKNRQGVMMNHFEDVKKELNEKLPLGIEDYQQMKKQKISEVIGLSEYEKRFVGVHDQVDRQINSRKQATKKELQDIVRQTEQEYKIDSQKLKVLHQMPEQKRAVIRERATKQFKQHIDKKFKQLQTKYEEQLSTEKQIKKIQKVVSMQQLDHLVSMAKNKFKTESINVMGGFMDSQIRV